MSSDRFTFIYIFIYLTDFSSQITTTGFYIYINIELLKMCDVKEKNSNISWITAKKLFFFYQLNQKIILNLLIKVSHCISNTIYGVHRNFKYFCHLFVYNSTKFLYFYLGTKLKKKLEEFYRASMFSFSSVFSTDCSISDSEIHRRIQIKCR